MSESAFPNIENLPNKVLLFYTDECNVCHSLQPRIARIMENDFPTIPYIEVRIGQADNLHVRFGVYTAPVLLAFLEGKEYIRQSRYISVGKFAADLNRLLTLINDT